MPGPTKRTRTTSAQDESEDQPSSSEVPPTSTPTRRRTTATTSTAPTTFTTPTRPILTRSSATTPTMNPPLTRSSSMFLPSTRRNGNADSMLGAGGLGLPSPVSMIATPTGRGGTLTRTQSTPSLVSPAQLKAGVAGGSGPSRGKGDDEDFDGLGGRRSVGKGKENVPPKKDEEDENGSRKRLRVGRRSSTAASARARSGSVSSLRSEATGRLPSLAPSTSSSFGRRGSRFPSPTPSMSSITTPSLESFSSFTSLEPSNPMDSLMDVDKTPTKPKTRAQAHQVAIQLPSPPSSPFIQTPPDIDATAERMGLVRMRSDVSDDPTEVETDTEDEPQRKHINPYKQIKAFLRLSTSPKQTIVGREEETIALRAYLADQNSIDVGMYVSGPPGTGKTATVTSLGRQMRTEGWHFIELGCMGLKVADVWRRMGEQMGCGKTERDVVAHLESGTIRTLLLLDEIDSLLPAPPAIAPPATSHLLSKIFSLPTQSAGRVKLVGISNTLDLTLRARLVLPEGANPLVLPFKAYAGSDMINIVAHRLAIAEPTADEGESAKVDPKAVELLTKKVEAQNGDLRMCLGVLSMAVTLAEGEWSKKVTAAIGTCHPVPLTKISLAHTIKAFNSHTQQLKAAAGSSSTATASVTGRKIRSVPLQGKMVLLAALIYSTRIRAGLSGSPAGGSTGTSTPTSTPSKSSEALTTANLYATYAHLLSHTSSPFPPSSESDYRDLLSNLEVLGLVSVSAGAASMSRTGSGATRKGAQGARVELCVRDDEIKEGLGLVEGVKGKGVAEEEVGKVWEREEGKIKRAKEKLGKSITALCEDF